DLPGTAVEKLVAEGAATEVGLLGEKESLFEGRADHAALSGGPEAGDGTQQTGAPRTARPQDEESLAKRYLDRQVLDAQPALARRDQGQPLEGHPVGVLDRLDGRLPHLRRLLVEQFVEGPQALDNSTEGGDALELLDDERKGAHHQEEGDLRL